MRILWWFIMFGFLACGILMVIKGKMILDMLLAISFIVCGLVTLYGLHLDKKKTR